MTASRLFGLNDNTPRPVCTMYWIVSRRVQEITGEWSWGLSQLILYSLYTFPTILCMVLWVSLPETMTHSSCNLTLIWLHPTVQCCAYSTNLESYLHMSRPPHVWSYCLCLVIILLSCANKACQSVGTKLDEPAHLSGFCNQQSTKMALHWIWRQISC